VPGKVKPGALVMIARECGTAAGGSANRGNNVQPDGSLNVQEPAGSLNVQEFNSLKDV